MASDSDSDTTTPIPARIIVFYFFEHQHHDSRNVRPGYDNDNDADATKKRGSKQHTTAITNIKQGVIALYYPLHQTSINDADDAFNFRAAINLSMPPSSSPLCIMHNSAYLSYSQ